MDSIFPEDPDFCSVCGTIYCYQSASTIVTCVNCGNKLDLSTIEHPVRTTRVYLNRISTKPGNKFTRGKGDGPIADRKCRKCEHQGMSYVTLQLRSADEGQTIIYTCVECGEKEVENS